jgi:hypothetical protein
LCIENCNVYSNGFIIVIAIYYVDDRLSYGLIKDDVVKGWA